MLDFCSVVVLALPLADGVLVLPDDALPEVVLWASVLGFCSWLIGGVWACDSCFFSCATAPNDSNAAVTATAMGLNLMEISFDRVDYPKKAAIAVPASADLTGTS